MTTRRAARAAVVGIAAAVVASVCTVPAAAQGAGGGAAERGATQRAFERVVANGAYGVTGQARKGHGVWKGAAGVGDVRTGAPRGKNDRFRIASITKTFVATVLLQQEAEGKLDLDDTVERWLPGLVRGNGHDGRNITVRQLLNHTSGVFDYLTDEDYMRDYMFAPNYLKNRFLDRAPEVAVAVAMRHAPTGPPGARQSYSNTNYVLAALVMEKAGGRSYEREVRERIIKPLKLRGTVMPGNTLGLPQPSSRSYSVLSPDPNATKVYDVTLQNGSQSWAEGDMISSAGDLNRFLGALLGGELLPARQLAAMKTLVPDESDPGTGYGLGLEKMRTACGTVWGHTGGWMGSVTVAVATEDGKHSLAYNLNSDWTSKGLEAPLNAEFCGTEPEGAGPAGGRDGVPRR
ncbi:serine hydrolase domain-containing protein [Streptomyces sp. NPDC049906]|uniref:serine hydrolase domain-containing protein n=1 Tax=Streptomyces sp. NPDC049906 TaxID=3155656 RepID=UPI00343C0B88